MGYRVKFTNPATGEGYIETYRHANTAKYVVARCERFWAEGYKGGMIAEYLGKPMPYVKADPVLKRKLGLR